MHRRREDGFCEVSTKRGQCWSLPRDQYARVRTAWLKGVRFIDTVDFHGSPLTLKTDEVDGVADVPADVVHARIAERRMDDHDDSLQGSS